MSFKEKYLSKKKIKEFLIINIGIFLVALAFTFILDYNNFVFGGVGGIGIILKNVFDEKVPSSIIILIVNIILLIFGLIFLGKSFFLKTIYGTVVYPVYSFILEQTIPDSLYPVAENNVLILVLGGSLLMGAGLGLAMRYGSSTGGIDIIQLLLLKYCKIPLSISLIILDGSIIVVGAIAGISSLEPVFLVLYGIAYTAITGMVMDSIVFGGFNVRTAYIVTDKSDEIKQKIFEKLDRGVTELYSRGGYSLEDKKTLICVLTTGEYYILRSLATSIDPNVFIFVTKASEVHGEGFSSEHQIK